MLTNFSKIRFFDCIVFFLLQSVYLKKPFGYPKDIQKLLRIPERTFFSDLGAICLYMYVRIQSVLDFSSHCLGYHILDIRKAFWICYDTLPYNYFFFLSPSNVISVKPDLPSLVHVVE